MNAKAKLEYMTLGAAIGICELAVGVCVLPRTVQQNTFGEILGTIYGC